MRLNPVLAAAVVALPIVRGAAAQNAPASATPPLDGFTAQYGYPTFPAAPVYDVPYIWNGPDYDNLRIGDLIMIPTINQAASGVPGAPSRPGIGVFSHH